MEGRDGKGRFIKGNKCGHGTHNSGRKPEEYRNIFKKIVTFDQWKLVLIEALEEAKEGDDKARKFLADYLIGSPKQFVDLTTMGKKLFETPLDLMNAEQRSEYLSKLATALSGCGQCHNLENTEQ